MCDAATQLHFSLPSQASDCGASWLNGLSAGLLLLLWVRSCCKSAWLANAVQLPSTAPYQYSYWLSLLSNPQERQADMSGRSSYKHGRCYHVLTMLRAQLCTGGGVFHWCQGGCCGTCQVRVEGLGLWLSPLWPGAEQLLPDTHSATLDR